MTPALCLVLYYVLKGADVEALVSGVVPFTVASKYSDRAVDAPWWYVPWRLLLHLDAKFPSQLLCGAIVVFGVLVLAVVFGVDLLI